MTQTVYDTFTSQGKFYVAGEEVSENVYNRVQEANALLDEVEALTQDWHGNTLAEEVAAVLSKRVKL